MNKTQITPTGLKKWFSSISLMVPSLLTIEEFQHIRWFLVRIIGVKNSIEAMAFVYHPMSWVDYRVVHG